MENVLIPNPLITLFFFHNNSESYVFANFFFDLYTLAKYNIMFCRVVIHKTRNNIARFSTIRGMFYNFFYNVLHSLLFRA